MDEEAAEASAEDAERAARAKSCRDAVLNVATFPLEAVKDIVGDAVVFTIKEVPKIIRLVAQGKVSGPDGALEVHENYWREQKPAARVGERLFSRGFEDHLHGRVSTATPQVRPHLLRPRAREDGV